LVQTSLNQFPFKINQLLMLAKGVYTNMGVSLALPELGTAQPQLVFAFYSVLLSFLGFGVLRV
jgi:hypothetical protein